MKNLKIFFILSLITAIVATIGLVLITIVIINDPLAHKSIYGVAFVLLDSILILYFLLGSLFREISNN